LLALELDGTAVKGFMGKLLREDIFDAFEVRAVEILTANRITIEGALETSPSDENENESDKKSGFTTWAALRPLVYEIIKLSQKPKLIKLVCSHKEPGAVDANAAALFLNLSYENDGVTFTTATAQRQFVLDKSLDSAWDDWVRGFFAKIGLGVRDRV